MSVSEAIRIASILTQKTPKDHQRLEKMEISALKELGNVMAGSYMRVLAEEKNLNISLSIPAFGCEKPGPILNGMVA